MEERPPQCSKKKQGFTIAKGRKVWGFSISFHLSRLQCAPLSSSLKHNPQEENAISNAANAVPVLRVFLWMKLMS
jgi:hypothetical protein